MAGDGVTVVVPAFNEAARIGATVAAAGRIPSVAEVWVVDDGSADGTAEAARRAGARVWRLPRNVGKGAALASGLAKAATDVIVTVDADVGVTAAASAPLIDAVRWEGADLAIGSIGPAGNSQGWGLVRRLAAYALRRRFGRRLASPLSGQRALRRQVLVHLLPLAPGWGCEVGMTWDALRAGLRVVEVPVAMAHRATGKNWAGIRHRSAQLRDVLWALGGRRMAVASEGDEPWPP